MRDRSDRLRKKDAVLPEEDDLLTEYSLRSLRVVARGPGRKAPESTIQLEPEVAKAFPDSKSVNEALRLLMRLAKSQIRRAR